MGTENNAPGRRVERVRVATGSGWGVGRRKKLRSGWWGGMRPRWSDNIPGT